MIRKAALDAEMFEVRFDHRYTAMLTSAVS
jgi:hypothetical protein